jgi:hypothetical protein
MKLTLLKLNNQTYYFNKKINIFLGEKNSGKTTLFNLIKFIYGAEYKKGKPFHKAIGSISNIHKDYLIEWQFDEQELITYSLNLSNKMIITSNNIKVSLNDYSQFIISKFKISNKVFNKNLKFIECFSYDEDITKKLNSTADYAKFFSTHNDMSYTAICFLKLINEKKLAEKMQKYFTLYGKKQNFEKIKKASSGLQKEIDTNLIDSLLNNEENRSTTQRYVELSKLNRTETDTQLFRELEELCKGLIDFNINNVKKFHDDLIDSYNEVIEMERNQLININNVLNEYTKDEINEAISYYNLFNEMKVEINKINPELINESKVLDDSENDLDEINKRLKTFCDDFNHNFKVIKEFCNRLEYKISSEKKTHIILNLRNKDYENVNSGGSDTIINFLGFLTFVLINSNFPLLLFEKSFIIENQNATIVELLYKIANIIDNSKMLIVTLHPDEEIISIHEGSEDVQIIECDKNFFDVQF